MLTALFSFLGGSAFRLIFGAVMDWFNKRQDHQNEMELQRLQSDLEAARHTRDMERIKIQSDLNIKEVQIAGDVAEQKAMADAFLEAVKATGIKTGIGFVDAWNASIRPAGASVSLLIWVGTMISVGLVLTEFDRTLIAAFLGVFVGDRIHTRGRM